MFTSHCLLPAVVRMTYWKAKKVWVLALPFTNCEVFGNF